MKFFRIYEVMKAQKCWKRCGGIWTHPFVLQGPCNSYSQWNIHSILWMASLTKVMLRPVTAWTVHVEKNVLTHCAAKEFFTSLYSFHICECFRVHLGLSTEQFVVSSERHSAAVYPLQVDLKKKHKISNCMSKTPVRVCIWNWGFKPHISTLTVAEFNRKCWCYFSSLKDFPAFEEMIWKDTLSLKWGAVKRAAEVESGVQSRVSIPLSSRSCLHALSTWGRHCRAPRWT